jgi:hypothetical protein
MRTRYERLLNGMDTWCAEQSNRVVVWAIGGFSLLFVLTAWLLIWLLSSLPK